VWVSGQRFYYRNRVGLQGELSVEAIVRVEAKVKRVWLRTPTQFDFWARNPSKGSWLYMFLIVFQYIVHCMNIIASTPIFLCCFCIILGFLPRNCLASRDVLLGGTSVFIQIMGSVMNCLAARRNRQAMRAVCHCFIRFLGILWYVELLVRFLCLCVCKNQSLMHY